MGAAYVVIPALRQAQDKLACGHAGIQQDKYSAKRTIIGFVPLRGNYSINWIPACAGMTEL
jgi:hypothetical protein